MPKMPDKHDQDSFVHELADQAPPVAVPAENETRRQDAEWFLVKTRGAWQEIRLHDYPDIYAIQGLYEKIVYDILECRSPEIIRDEFVNAVRKAGGDPSGLTVLDLGAGNGIVAEELRNAGVGTGVEGGFIGADLLPEAAQAAERDRPGLYDDYVVGDMTNLDPKEEAKLEEATPDVLTCVAALGFGDIPPEAFVAAYQQIAIGGWLAFCIKDEFIKDNDRSGFAKLIDDLIADGSIEVVSTKKYTHRKAFSGQPLSYVSYIARKMHEDPKP